MNTNIRYIITYKHWLEFNGRKLAFKKKELFDITESPKHIPFNEYWYINRKKLSVQQAKQLIRNESIEVDVSNLQWYDQERLNHVFNL